LVAILRPGEANEASGMALTSMPNGGYASLMADLLHFVSCGCISVPRLRRRRSRACGFSFDKGATSCVTLIGYWLTGRARLGQGRQAKIVSGNVDLVALLNVVRAAQPDPAHAATSDCCRPHGVPRRRRASGRPCRDAARKCAISMVHYRAPSARRVSGISCRRLVPLAPRTSVPRPSPQDAWPRWPAPASWWWCRPGRLILALQL